jgi:hypothetical protein
MFSAAGKCASFTEPMTIQSIGTFASSSNSTTYNCGNFTSSESALIVVAVASVGGSSRTISSVSIGGDAAAIVANSPSGTVRTAIAYYERAAGTFNITVSLSGSSGTGTGFGVDVYELTGYLSTTPIDTDNAATLASATLVSSILIEDGGATIFANANDTSASVSYSSATINLNNLSNDSKRTTGASKASVGSAQHSETLTIGTNTTNNKIVSSSSWR